MNDRGDGDRMERTRRGDPEALGELLCAYWDPLVAYAGAIVGGADAAEDVVQRAFVKVWQARETWVPQGTVHGYLYRIVRNLALDERKARRVRRRWLEAWAPVRPRVAPAQDAGPARDEIALALDRAIEALPARRREVFTLARLHGLAYREIAEVMGISRQTVANQMGAALTELRRTLEPVYRSLDVSRDPGRPRASALALPHLLPPERRTEELRDASR